MLCQCDICRDAFDNVSEVGVADCGHLFHLHCLEPWVKKNPTCPSCRNRVRNSQIRRVFLSILDTSLCEPHDDAAEVRQTLHALREKFSRLEQENSALKRRFEQLEQSSEKLKNKYSSATEEARSLRTSVKVMKGVFQENDSLKKTVTDLHEKLTTTRNFDTVLQGTIQGVEDLMRTYGAGESSVRQIATYCVLLKRELEAAKSEVSFSRQQISSLTRQKSAVDRELCEKTKALESTTSELAKYRDQCFSLTERLENLPENPQATSSSAASQRRPSSDYEGLAVKRVKRNKSIVSSPPVLKTNLHGVQNPDSARIPLVRTLPGYTKMKITSTLRKPEAVAKPSGPDELLLTLMKSKTHSSDKDSIQRKGYNGLGGHSSHIQVSKRVGI